MRKKSCLKSKIANTYAILYIVKKEQLQSEPVSITGAENVTNRERKVTMFLKSRNYLSILIAGILSLSLAACGGNTASTSSASSAGANDAGSVSTAADAEPAGDDTESTDAAAAAETNEVEKSADSVQDRSAEPAYKTADYLQDEIVIADTDQYKLTVTGFDPDYAKDGYEGFLVYLEVENKADKEFSYGIQGGSVNHAILDRLTWREDLVVPSGDSAEMEFLIYKSYLEEYNISSVDAVSVDLRAMSTELKDAYKSGQMDAANDLIDTDFLQGSYTFSPTGMDYEEAAPPDVFTGDKYDILTDNEVLTLGVRKNENETAIYEEGIYYDIIVRTDETENILIEVTDVTVDGTSIYLDDGNGEIMDIPYAPNYSAVSNTLFVHHLLIDKETLDGNKIENPETLQFRLVIRSEDAGSELYNEMLSYSFK